MLHPLHRSWRRKGIILVVSAGVLSASIVALRRPSPIANDAEIAVIHAGSSTQLSNGERMTAQARSSRALSRGCVFGGTVVSDSEKVHALTGATVCLLAKDEEYARECVATDAHGRFSLEPVPLVAGARLIASALGHASQAHAIEAPGECQQADLVIRLAAGGVEVSGSIIDATGGVISGAQVTAHAHERNFTPPVTISGGDGSFRLMVPPGMVDVVVTAEAYSQSEQAVIAPQESVIFTLVPAATISGKVVLESGEPVPSAQVVATNKNGIAAAPTSTWTDAVGHFVLGQLAAGGYDVAAAAEGLRAKSQWVTVGLSETVSLELVATRAATVHATVDVAGARCVEGVVLLGGAISARGQIDETGTAQVPGLPRGRYRATVKCTQVVLGDDRKTRRDVVAGLDDIVLVTSDRVEASWSLVDSAASTSLPRGKGMIRVSVEGVDRAKAPRRVLAQGPDGLIVGHADDDSVIFANLARGDYEVYLETSPALARRVTLRDDAAQAQLTLVQPSMASISGRVLDDTDNPVPDAWVVAVSAGSQGAPNAAPAVLSGTTGEFVVKDLPQGMYDITATSRVGEGLQQRIATGSDSVQVRIAVFGSIAGTFETEDGEAVDMFALSYGRSGTAVVESINATAGEWSLPWLQPGSYRLSAVAAVGCGATQIDLPPGGHLLVPLRTTLTGDACRTIGGQDDHERKATPANANAGSETAPVATPQAPWREP
jgi:hypothetical protein